MTVSNYGKNFYIGFMRKATSSLRLVVGTESSSPVQFAVEYLLGPLRQRKVYRGSTNATNPDIVNLTPASLLVTDDIFDRNKGIHVYSIGEGSISVLAINYEESNVGNYQAYPCPASNSGTYEYLVASPRVRYFRPTEFQNELLLVGCEDNTSVILTPNLAVTIPNDVQSNDRIEIRATAGLEHQFTLNQMQTLLLRNQSDFGGTRIVSNKPLTVISGHECEGAGSSCEHFSVQMLPLFTLGTRFMLIPYDGSNAHEGQGFRVIASQDGTSVVHTCADKPTTLTLPWPYPRVFTSQFSVTSSTFCTLVSNKPVSVLNIGYSGRQRTTGDRLIIPVPPLSQYTDKYTFYSLNLSDFHINQISVSVLLEFFQPSSIRLDGQPIQAIWTPTHTSEGSILGYVTRVSVSGGTTHTVAHDNPRAKLAVMVYGWSSNYRRTYGYLAAQRFTAIPPGMNILI